MFDVILSWDEFVIVLRKSDVPHFAEKGQNKNRPTHALTHIYLDLEMINQSV